MAMKIGGKYKPRDVHLRHFHKMVADTKAAQSAMDKQIKMMSSEIIDVATTLKKELQEEGLTSDVFEKIIEIIKERSHRFSEEALR